MVNDQTTKVSNKRERPPPTPPPSSPLSRGLRESTPRSPGTRLALRSPGVARPSHTALTLAKKNFLCYSRRQGFTHGNQIRAMKNEQIHLAGTQSTLVPPQMIPTVLLHHRDAAAYAHVSVCMVSCSVQRSLAFAFVSLFGFGMLRSFSLVNVVMKTRLCTATFSARLVTASMKKCRRTAAPAHYFSPK